MVLRPTAAAAVGREDNRRDSGAALPLLAAFVVRQENQPVESTEFASIQLAGCALGVPRASATTVYVVHLPGLSDGPPRPHPACEREHLTKWYQEHKISRKSEPRTRRVLSRVR